MVTVHPSNAAIRFPPIFRPAGANSWSSLLARGANTGGIAVGEIPQEPLCSLAPSFHLHSLDGSESGASKAGKRTVFQANKKFTQSLSKLKILALSHSQITELPPCFGGVSLSVWRCSA